MPSRLYVDNAATSHPKPPQVLEAMRAYATNLGVSAGRGVYQEAVEAGEIVSDCRRRLAGLISAEAPWQVVFTLNGTAALNLVLKGLLRDADHVVTTTMEHNSVLRPLSALGRQRGIEATYVPADPVTGCVPVDQLLAAFRPRTRLVCVVHASNVTGTVQPVADIGAEARRRGVFLLVDAAQTVGHLPIDVRAMGIDFLAMPGHKGLLGPLGTGALYIRPGLEGLVRPLVEGGTGTVSEQPVQPDSLPDKFESGSVNTLGLAGLGAALRWIEDETIEKLRAQDVALSTRFLEQIADSEGLTLHGPQAAQDRVAVFSVSVAGLAPMEVSVLLEAEFGVLTRSGLHCAPLAHKTIGTYENGGTTRLSFGPFNTVSDVDRCAEALRELARAHAPA